MEVEVERHGGAVVRVAVSHAGFTHRLQGHDHYWIDRGSLTFGQYNVDEGYKGRRAVAYRCTDRGFALCDAPPPPTAETWVGEWVSDADARTLGLL